MARPRDAAGTRGGLLDAARAQFAREGFDRVTVRSVAAEVGVDPALVTRYFGSKAGLFAEAARLEFSLPDPTGLGPTPLPMRSWIASFSSTTSLPGLMRSAATSSVAAEQMLGVVREQATPALAAAAVDRPAERAALVGSHILDFTFVRYVLGARSLAAMTRDEVRAWVGPVLARYLTDPDLQPQGDTGRGNGAVVSSGGWTQAHAAAVDGAIGCSPTPPASDAAVAGRLVVPTDVDTCHHPPSPRQDRFPSPTQISGMLRRLNRWG